MDDAKQLWSTWQRYLNEFATAFTAPGWVHFAQWVTGTVLCDEQHTITQIITGMGVQDQWRNWEKFAEYGVWDERRVEQCLIELAEREAAARFAGYRPVAVDDTKELRWSLEAWGVCTFKHVGRNANRPKLVRGHNWVVMGDLSPGAPWRYRPLGGRLYMRQSQMPGGEVFHTKLHWALEMLKQADAGSAAPVLAVLDGGFARQNLVRPCSQCERAIRVLTQPRSDARLFAALPPPPPEGDGKTSHAGKRGGRPRKWGRRWPSPKKHGQWAVRWEKGTAYIYGRRRRFRCKRLDCRWSVAGPDVPVVVFVFQVEGYKKDWYLVTTAVEVYAGRFRQEDGIRDQKQRMGMEEVRAWTKNPVLRTFLVQTVAMSLLRLVQNWLEEHRGPDWNPAPPWNPRKRYVSILDLRRLFWTHRERFSQFTQRLAEVAKPRRDAA